MMMLLHIVMTCRLATAKRWYNNQNVLGRCSANLIHCQPLQPHYLVIIKAGSNSDFNIQHEATTGSIIFGGETGEDESE